MTSQLQEKVFLYYAGKLPKEEIVEMFRELVKDETLWHLPISFVETAITLWEAGYIGPPKNLRGMES